MQVVHILGQAIMYIALYLDLNSVCISLLLILALQTLCRIPTKNEKFYFKFLVRNAFLPVLNVKIIDSHDFFQQEILPRMKMKQLKNIFNRFLFIMNITFCFYV